MGHENPARPYEFERVFALSAADATRNPQDLALHLMSLEAELEEYRRDTEPALQQARADGFAAGLAQARTETAAALLTAESRLASAIAALEAGFCATETRMAATAAAVCLAAAEMLAARAIAEVPTAAIDAAIARVLAQTGFRERLHVRVHPTLAVSVRALVDGRQSTEQRPLQIAVHEDDSVAVGDVHILWDEGGLSLDAAARNAAVRDALGIAAVID